jgi:hypothetical protein
MLSKGHEGSSEVRALAAAASLRMTFIGHPRSQRKPEVSCSIKLAGPVGQRLGCHLIYLLPILSISNAITLF